ncbi:GGDEF domain-containing protein [Pontibacter sp. JAM-7]|uniref:GGDEF domain-containing protein n=1 Tax=Pontibacter sp. JAM-7 TaxID=3366581 RepID=UPI003AF5C100
MAELQQYSLPHLLVIEDDRVCLTALSQMLHSNGFEISLATTGDTALSLFDQHFDLILLDLNLPDMTGHELLRQIKKHPQLSDVPVICVSASDQYQDIQLMFTNGALDYVIKPYHELVLISKIRTLIDLKRKTELLNKLAVKDALTGVYNRRALEERLVNEWRRAMRYRREFSVLMVDMDHFKLVNDQLSHKAGDEYLIYVANILQSHARRPSDVVVRYGGDEFVILLPDTILEDAMTIAERIRFDISNLCQTADLFKHTNIQPSATIGCASNTPSFDSSGWNLIETADDCMMQVKKTGQRNLVCSASNEIKTA